MKLSEFKVLTVIVANHEALKLLQASPKLNVNINGVNVSLASAATFVQQQVSALENQLTAAGIDING